MMNTSRMILAIALMAALAACSSDDGGDGNSNGGGSDAMAGDSSGGGSDAMAEDGSGGGGVDAAGGDDDSSGGEDVISVSDALVCLQTNCGSELDACNADAGCKAFIDCVTACDDFECTEACVEPEGDASLSLLEGVGLCGMVNECLPEEPDETPAGVVACIDDACADEAAACAGDTFCNDTRTCIATCDTSDCVDSQCLPEEATPSTAFSAWIICGDAEGCVPDDGEGEGEDDCVIDMCGAEVAACFGNDECAGVFDCLDACDESSEDGCELACINALSGDAADAFDAVFQCVSTKCPDEGGGEG